MTLRVLAVLTLLLGLGALFAFLHLVGKGPFASPPERHLRAMKSRATEPPAVENLDFAALGALPRSRPLAEYAAVERRGARIEGYVQRMLRSVDGDFHLSLAPVPAADPHQGPHRPNAIAEITPQWQRGSSTWTYERLCAVFRPFRGGVTRWQQPPRRVRLTGWLMYDYPHEGLVPADVHSLPAVAAWEIHPVTRIEYWDETRNGFVEYAR